MINTLRLMADYGCSPLWQRSSDGTRNVGLDELPITDGLRQALIDWAAAYDRTLNAAYPPDSGFVSTQAENDFELEGQRLWRLLQSELGHSYRIVYFSNRDRRERE